MTEEPVCQHLRLKPDLSATTSVIAIETHLWGVICEDCGEKWDIGQVLQAIPDLAAARLDRWQTLPNEDGEGGMTWRAWAADLDMQRQEVEDRLKTLAQFDVDTLRVCAETIYGKHQDERQASVRQARHNEVQRLATALEGLR
jgi:hypothetical protein